MNRFKKITLFFLFGIFIFPKQSFGQEFTLKETPEMKEKKEEEQYLNFQKYFFEALHQKAGEDYNKAIESLDYCKAIYPENAALNFEYAKNYLKLKDYDNAVFFDEKALLKKPDNIHILEHLKEAYRLQHDYKNAIAIQKKLVALKPSKENGLVYLYINNNQKDKAKTAYLKLEKLGLLDLRKSYFKRVLFPEKVKKRTKNVVVKEVVNNNTAQNNTVKNDKSYKSFLKLLAQEEQANQFELLVKDSEEALSLFPAQPLLYLKNAKAQNTLNKYKKALLALDSGLDFIIDNDKMLADYYEQMQIAYLGLGQNAKATKYQNKALALRKSN